MAPVRKPRRELRRHFFKEWREYRGLTQERAAERLDIDRTTLGRIESRKLPYSQGLLEAAAEAYRCDPWDILNVNPLVEGEVVDFTRLIREAKPEERAEILGYARGLLRRSNAS